MIFSLIYQRVLMIAVLCMAVPVMGHGFTKVYATNLNGQVSILDADTNTFIENITLVFGDRVSGNLQGVAISPDATKAYIVDQTNLGVWTVDTGTNAVDNFTILDTEITAEQPAQIAILPDGSKVYVADRSAGVVWIMETASFALSYISGGPTKPSGLAVNPEGSKLYVLSNAFFANTVYVYETATDTPSVPATISLTHANFLAINNNNIGYVPNITSSDVFVFDAVTDTQSPSISAGGFDLNGVDFISDGTKAYVGSTILPSLLIIDNGVFTGRISLAHIPWDVVINPANNAQVYCTGQIASSVMTVYNEVQVSNPDFDANIVDAVYLAFVLSTDPASPQNLSGSVIKNKFVMQTDIIHELKWSPSPSPDVVAYAIYRNGKPIATVSAQSPLRYMDHNRSSRGSDLYQIRAINTQNIQGISAFIQIP